MTIKEMLSVVGTEFCYIVVSGWRSVTFDNNEADKQYLVRNYGDVEIIRMYCDVRMVNDFNMERIELRKELVLMVGEVTIKDSRKQYRR